MYTNFSGVRFIIIMLLISKQYSLITDQDMLQEVCTVLQTWNADRQFASTWWHQNRAANDRVPHAGMWHLYYEQ